MIRSAGKICSSACSWYWSRQLQCGVRSRGFVSQAQQSTPKAFDAFGPLTEIEKIMIDSVKVCSTVSGLVCSSLMYLIKATGSLSFATYMQLCLSHPVHGYYMNPDHEVFGARGDFTTSPEISQVFGELVAVWLLERWMTTAPSKPFRLVELGPGRGTLMDDMLRVFRQFPAARANLESVHLVETSPAMRTLQESKLRDATQGGKPKAMWHNAVDEVPQSADTYTMLVAHELFDALPVHIIERTSQGWHEVLITLSKDQSIRYTMPVSRSSGAVLLPTTSSTNSRAKPQAISSRWTPVLSPTPTASSTLLGNVSARFAQLPVGSRIEISTAGVKTARAIANLIGGNGEDGASGCALIVDYGAEHAFGNSLRAFKDHKIVDIFHLPGECDITANVDFALLKESLGDHATPLGTLHQGTFLKRLGVQLRAASLMRTAPSAERKKAIEDGVNRLIDPLGMGGQYSVLGIVSRKSKDKDVWPFMDANDGGSSMQL
ncbi:hypothetical protein ID866_5998 [Astraeus odoratus]|nr:hypothetical protein ID866_5998 [Astraeus odoratus]